MSGLSPAALDKRKRYLTASDGAAVLARDEFKTSADVWLEKCLSLTPTKTSEAAWLGLAVEPGLLAWCKEEIGAERIRSQQWRVSADHPLFGATLDAIRMDPGHRNEMFEAKTHGLLGPPFEEWDNPHEKFDGVPWRVIVQTQIGMLCSECDTAHVAALIGGRGRLRYKVSYHHKLTMKIVAELEEWWGAHVIERVPPDTSPSMETIKRVKRIPNYCRMVDRDLVEYWQDLARQANQLKKELEKAKGAVAMRLLDAEVGEFGDPEKVVSYFANKAGNRTLMVRKRKGLDIDGAANDGNQGSQLAGVEGGSDQRHAPEELPRGGGEVPADCDEPVDEDAETA